jgi:hypothetical protein
VGITRKGEPALILWVLLWAGTCGAFRVPRRR